MRSLSQQTWSMYLPSTIQFNWPLKVFITPANWLNHVCIEVKFEEVNQWVMLSPSSFFIKWFNLKNICMFNYITLTKISIYGFKPNVIGINEQKFYQQIVFLTVLVQKKITCNCTYRRILQDLIRTVWIFIFILYCNMFYTFCFGLQALKLLDWKGLRKTEKIQNLLHPTIF